MTGRIKRSLLDQVIAYWLTSHRMDVVSVERLFDEFKTWLLDGDSTASEVIQEIRRFADLYDRLVNDPPDEPTAALVDLVIATKTNTAWPLILGIYGDERVSEVQRRKAASVLSSYLTRRMLCGLTTKDYNRIFVAVLLAAKARAALDGLAGDAVEHALGRLAGESRNWPGDGEFLGALLGSNFYGLARARQRTFFAGIENYLRDDRAEDAAPIRARWDYLNIEHVMPQTWQEHWPIADEASEEAVSRREQAINMVGNLTLTNGRLNSQMRHEAWPTKKLALQQKSTMLITTASILSAPPGDDASEAASWATEWDEGRIATRSAYLSHLAVRAWPRPDIAPAEEVDDESDSMTDQLDEDDDALE